MAKIDIFRKKYPRFVYKNYSWKILNKDLKIFFNFSIEPGINFKPKIEILNVPPDFQRRVGDRLLNNLIFHLGLIETLSYWKATCSPEIEIRAGPLNNDQIKWWRDLILKGMGQFFYENKIDFLKPNFINISSINVAGSRRAINVAGSRRNVVLVPIGGGKDSVVTLEILKKTEREIQCFSLNSTEAAQKIMKIAGCKSPIIVRQKIDEKLLELNRKGFLNGHTPFSAYLAFLSVLCAAVFNCRYIAFSNERSSNEGNLKYLDRIINHQYSKSFDFEKKFRKYSRKYLTSAIEYFSFLRPLYEIQIAKIFSHFPQYFSAFLSCNVAYQTASGTKKPTKKWCGKCSKCLFVFAVLYPFVESKKLFKIFRKNPFEDRNLLPIMQELIGEKRFKPFECVGTKKESLIAFYLSYKKYIGDTYVKLPFLLKYFEKKILIKQRGWQKKSKEIMNSWNNNHYLPKDFEKILKQKFDKFS